MKNKIDFMFMFIDKMIFQFIKIVEKVLKRRIRSSTAEEFIKITKFGIVGVSNCVVNYITYFIFIKLLNKFFPISNFNYLYAQVMAFLISVFWSFYFNLFYVFEHKNLVHKNILIILLKTYASYAITGLFLSELLLFIEIQYWKIPDMIAPIINIVVCLPINYMLNKLWAFKRS